jgi:hypothetical protein
MSVCLCACQPICVQACLLIHVCLFVCLSAHLCLFVCLSICLLLPRLSVCLFECVNHFEMYYIGLLDCRFLLPSRQLDITGCQTSLTSEFILRQDFLDFFLKNRQRPSLQNFLWNLFVNISNRLERLYLAGFFSLV